jgi:hypothetical protein
VTGYFDKPVKWELQDSRRSAAARSGARSQLRSFLPKHSTISSKKYGKPEVARG